MCGNLINYFLKYVNDFRRAFPDIYREAISSLKKRRVKKYVFFDRGLVTYLVVGFHGEYLVNIVFYPSFKVVCTCPDFLYNVLLKIKGPPSIGDRGACYHVLAVMISILAEYAFHIDARGMKRYRKSELLPEVVLENIDYMDMVLDDIQEIVIDQSRE